MHNALPLREWAARFESDWVDDLGGSLSEAVAAAEKHDRKGLRYDITSFSI
jgi:hypothetical protein